MGKDIDEAAVGFGNVFRDRLTYLMNGNNVYGKASSLSLPMKMTSHSVKQMFSNFFRKKA